MVTAANDEWPDHLERAAEAYELGLLQLWQKSDLKQAAAWALALPFVAAGFLLTLGIVIPLVVGYEPGEVSWTGSFPFFIFALLLAALGVYLLIKVRRAPERWIGIHQDGLIYQMGDDGPVALAWSEIDRVTRDDTAVYNNGSFSHVNYSTIVHGAGVTISLDNAFGAVVELSEEIAARSGKEMRRRLSAAITSGGRVEFGSLGLTLDGVTSEGGVLPWSRVGDVRVREAQVRITEVGRRKPWATAPAPGFPNLAVFLALSHTLRTANRPTTDSPKIDDHDHHHL